MKWKNNSKLLQVDVDIVRAGVLLPSNCEETLSRVKIVRISSVWKWNIARSNEQRRVKFFAFSSKKTFLSLPLNIHSQWTVAMHYKYFNYVLLWRRRVKEKQTRRIRFFYDFIASARKFISARPCAFFPLIFYLCGWLSTAQKGAPPTCCDRVVQSSVIKVSISFHFLACHPPPTPPATKLLFEAT